MYFSFISVPPIFTSVACSRNWSTIQNVSQGGGRVLGGGLDWLALGHLQGGLVHVGASHSLLLLGIGVSIPVGVGVGCQIKDGMKMGTAGEEYWGHIQVWSGYVVRG